MKNFQRKTKMKYLVFLFLLGFVACGGNEDQSFIEESGTIETKDVIVSAQVGGIVTAIKYEEGDIVKIGDTLVIIDDEALVLQLKQAEAAGKMAEAQLSLLVKGARSEDINQTSEQVNQAKLNFASAESDYNRMKNLFEEKAITKKQFDDATTRYEVTKSQLNAVEQSYKKIKNIARPEEIAQAQANYDKSVSAVDLIKKSIRDSYIISPINGVIVKQFNEQGEFIPPMSRVMKLSDLSSAELKLYIAETSLAKVKLGQKVEVKNDTYPDKSYEGTITYISPEAEFTPKNIQTKDERTKLVYAVKVVIPNNSNELKSGMPADAKIYLKN